MQKGLFAAFSYHKIQWGYYAIACLFYLYILFTLVISARRAAIARGARVGQLFTSITTYTIIVWTMYPIIWALGAGTQKITVDWEIFLYAVVSISRSSEWVLMVHSLISWRKVCLVGGCWLRS